MITLLKKLFVENWLRKLISLFIAMIIWMVVNHSMTSTKTISDVSVRISQLPKESSVEGLEPGGLLKQKVALTLTGNKFALNSLTSSDLEVNLDLSDKPSEWTASIGVYDLISLNSDIDISKSISKVFAQELFIKQSRLISEKIPILISRPTGEAPKGYEFLDVWPYQLSVTVKGSQEKVAALKARGLKLTFNLSNISEAELEALQATRKQRDKDEVSFSVPNSWKKISIPSLSETPFEIDDPTANALRIDFCKKELLPIGAPLPVTIFYPPKYSNKLNPDTYQLATNDFITNKNGIKMITAPLYAQGVSRLFLDAVKDMIQVVIIASSESKGQELLWNTDFLYPQELENRYVAKLMTESTEDVADILPNMREDYLRNRFRSYMNRFRLYQADRKKLRLQIELKSNLVSVHPLLKSSSKCQDTSLY